MRRVLLTLFALILAGILGALWYANEKGFTKKWRGYVSEEFRKRGVEVTLRQLTLDPLRGLVARDVRVFDAEDRRRTLAVIDEMALQVNYANLIRGKTFLDALELREASLSLPLDPEKPRGAKIEIARLNARLFLPPQQIYLAYANAEVFGLRVSASGRLIHPQALQTHVKPREAISPGLVESILEEVGTLRAEGELPEMNVTFSGDLAAPDQIFVDLAFWGERLRRKNYSLRSLYLAASYRDGILDLKQLQATDAAGELRVSGLWELAERKARFQLRSTLDSAALARSAGNFPWLNDFVFYTPPRLELQADLSMENAFAMRLLGRIESSKFAYRTVIFDSGAADFSWDGQRWSLRDTLLTRPGGEALSGDILSVPQDFRARLRSTINPKAMRPLANGRWAEMLSQFEFPRPPEITLEARGTSPKLEDLTIDGDVSLRSAVFRGVAADSAQAKLKYENQILSLAPFHVTRPEGTGDGNLYFDFRRDEVRLEKIRTRVNPVEVAMWIEPKLVNAILPYRFSRQPPNLRIDGVVHTKRGKTTHLAIDVDAPAGLDYTFLQKNLSSPKASAKLLFTSERLKISDLSAQLLGGTLKGGLDVSLQPLRPGHGASLTAENIDFASLTKLYFDYDDSQGRLNGRYTFKGAGADARIMEGEGELTVTDGNVFSIPFLGPLSGVLDGIVPGMGHSVARRAATRFSIHGGTIFTDDFVVQGSGFSMIGNGRLHFLDDRMNFDMRINAQGLPGIFLFPVSKLFEYTADQKLSKPEWRLKIVPRM